MRASGHCRRQKRACPGKLFDVTVIYPCTGNTAAKLANGIVDTPVLLAAKAHLETADRLLSGFPQMMRSASTSEYRKADEYEKYLFCAVWAG